MLRKPLFTKLTYQLSNFTNMDGFCKCKVCMYVYCLIFYRPNKNLQFIIYRNSFT